MMKWCHYISLPIETINDKNSKRMNGSIMYIKKFLIEKDCKEQIKQDSFNVQTEYIFLSSKKFLMF